MNTITSNLAEDPAAQATSIAIAECHDAGELTRDTFAAFGRRGLLGLAVPGSTWGTPLAGGAAVIETIAHAGELGLGASLMAETFTIAPLLVANGTQDQRERYLEPMLSGERVGCIAITEPAGGSDIVRAVRTRAVRDGDHWVIDGEKLFITNGPIADFGLLLARTNGDSGSIGLTLFAVDFDSPGVEVIDKLDKIGLRRSPTGHISFKQVHVSNEQVVGRIDLGYTHVMKVLAFERALIAVAAIALTGKALEMAACLGAGVEDLRGEHQLHVAFVRGLIQQSFDGPPSTELANVAKIKSVEFAQRAFRVISHRADLLVDSDWFEAARRDLRVLSVFAGSSETLTEQLSGTLYRKLGK